MSEAQRQTAESATYNDNNNNIEPGRTPQGKLRLYGLDPFFTRRLYFLVISKHYIPYILVAPWKSQQQCWQDILFRVRVLSGLALVILTKVGEATLNCYNAELDGTTISKYHSYNVFGLQYCINVTPIVWRLSHDPIIRHRRRTKRYSMTIQKSVRSIAKI